MTSGSRGELRRQQASPRTNNAFFWQVLGELTVTVARAVADPPFPVQVTE